MGIIRAVSVSQAVLIFHRARYGHLSGRSEIMAVAGLVGMLCCADYVNYTIFYNNTEFFIRKYGHLQNALFEAMDP